MGPFMSTFENLLVLNFSKVDKMAPISALLQVVEHALALPSMTMGEEVSATDAAWGTPNICARKILQGYLAHKKHHPRRTLQYPYA